MTSSCNRMVCQQNITFLKIVFLQFNLLSDRLAHGTKMNRLMWCICYQSSGFVKNSTGKIQALLDVGGNSCTLQRTPHLLGNRHEEVTENGHLNRISLNADFTIGLGFNTQNNVTVFRYFCRTTGFNQNCGSILH